MRNGGFRMRTTIKLRYPGTGTKLVLAIFGPSGGCEDDLECQETWSSPCHRNLANLAQPVASLVTSALLHTYFPCCCRPGRITNAVKLKIPLLMALESLVVFGNIGRELPFWNGVNSPSSQSPGIE
jgi:hypothetical protein